MHPHLPDPGYKLGDTGIRNPGFMSLYFALNYSFLSAYITQMTCAAL